MRLLDKVAIVTGAGSGNGAAIAKGFLGEGAKVVYADINQEAAKKEAMNTGHPQKNWLAVKTDVSDQASVNNLILQTISTFSKLDIMVANAGITKKIPFLDSTIEDYEKIMNVNARGVYLCSLEAAQVMVEQESGTIIHMSSITSELAEPNAVAYGASKGAVGSMTRHMAFELGIKNIRVNAIAPGTIKTNLTAERLKDDTVLQQEAQLTMLKRVGKPTDLVGAAVLLASDESSFITGTHLYVDGGYSFK
ncbi:SDR family oxidoreductase [Lentibacillus sp. N15]|uniref:SDR family NAD(P)-dependent oxidoreductase n=1 Tax=Lentibacillus songyuanensis TaxID=3136161 RepID=UPI0031BA2C26